MSGDKRLGAHRLLSSLIGLSVLIMSLAFTASSFGQGLSDVGSFAMPEIRHGGIATSAATGDVFVLDQQEEQGGAVKKLSPGGAALLGEINGSETPAKRFFPFNGGVAIDESKDSSKGDVYVADGIDNVVDKFATKAGNPNEYEYVCQLTGPGGGCVKEGGTPTSAFSDPQGVAVDSQGIVYVANTFVGEIDEFDAEGNYIGRLVGADLPDPNSVAIAPNNTVYATNFFGDAVQLTLNGSHEVVSEAVLDPHETAGISADPLSGDAYVTDQEGGSHVVVYEPGGKVAEQFATKGELVLAGAIAYSPSDGTVYVADLEQERIVVFAKVPQVEALSATEVSSSVATLRGKVVPNAPSAEWHFEYGEGETYTSATAPVVTDSSGEVAAVVTNLKPGVLYSYRLVAVSSKGTAQSTGSSMRTLASVTDRQAFATNVSQLSATLNGTVDPGTTPTAYHFVYGTSTAYGQLVPSPDAYVPIGGTGEAVSQELVDLAPGTVYHFALVASSPAGTVVGPDETFRTPPVPTAVVETGSASGIGVGSATLSGVIDGQGWETGYYFEYGPSASYGSRWPSVDVSLGAFNGGQPITTVLQNLLPGAVYHYRLVAVNLDGASYGTDQAFTTLSYPSSVVQEPVQLKAPASKSIAQSKLATKKPAVKGKHKHKRKATKRKAKTKRKNKGKKA